MFPGGISPSEEWIFNISPHKYEGFPLHRVRETGRTSHPTAAGLGRPATLLAARLHGGGRARGDRAMSRQLPALGYRVLAWIRRHPIASGIIGVFLLLLLIGSLAGSPPKETPASSPAKITAAPTPTTSTTPSASPSSAAPSPTTSAFGSSGTTVAAPPPAAAATQPVQQQAPPPAPVATQAVQQQAPPPAPVATQAPPQAVQAPPPAAAPPASASFGSCAEARAAGAAPLYQGQPGYSSKLDRDHDGVACE